MAVCRFPDCGRPHLSRGLCQTHYWQDRRGEDLRPIKTQRKSKAAQPCAFEGCIRHATAKGLCAAHRRQQLDGKELSPLRGAYVNDCSFEGCDRPVKYGGLCETHAKQKQRGIKLKPIHEPTYRYVDGHGYVLLKRPDHPNARKNGIVFEHTVVMAEVLGRPLLPGENVHHKNGRRDDNRPENLELWVVSQPKGQRVEDHVAHAVEVLARYAPERLA